MKFNEKHKCNLAAVAATATATAAVTKSDRELIQKNIFK